MFCPTPVLLLAWLVGLVLGIGPTVSAAQGVVNVTVDNADELLASAPDTELAREWLLAAGETALSHDQPSDQPGGSVLTRTMLLIALAAPEEIERTNQQGTTIEVSPVEDFDAFVSAINYGEVISSNEDQRQVRVRIRPEEISEERVRARLEKVEDGATTRLGKMLLGEKPSSSGPPGAMHGNEEEAPGERLGGVIEPDDYVEIDLGGHAYAARVLLLERSFGDDVASLTLLDKASLESNTPQRKLKTRLQRAESFSLWAPVERLRKLAGPPAAKPLERTWTDTTGKFTVVATFNGLEGGSVRLKKRSGAEIKTPLNKLCEADRRYVQELEASPAANPFAEPKTDDAPGSLRADWSAVKQVRPTASRNWTFSPPKNAAVKPVAIKTTALEVRRPTDIGAIGEDLERMFVAEDGSSVVVVLSVGVGTKSKSYLQRLDFARGETDPLLVLPRESKVLDCDPAQRIVLLGSSDNQSDTAKVYVHRIEADRLAPVCDWDALPPKAFHRGLDAARLLGNGRVATKCTLGPWVVWGARTGKAELLLELDQADERAVRLAYGRRLMIASGGKGVHFIDVVSGKHLASLPHGLPRVDNLKVNPSLTRLALAYDRAAGVFDLRTGKLLEVLQGGLLQQAQLDFMGDLLLIDNQYLVEPTYPVLLWEYGMARDTGDSTHATVVADRLWYAVRNRSFNNSDKGPWNVVSIPAPHEAVKTRLAKLGGIESLVVLNLGDEVSVEIETDLDGETAKKFEQSLTKAITEAGFKVVKGPAERRVVAVCKAAEAPIEVLIADPDAKPPEDRPLAAGPPRA